MQQNTMTIRYNPPITGIASVLIGGFSMVPFAGILSPIGLILGIMALFKNQRILGVVGISISLLSLVTSPIMWALLFCALSARGTCNLNQNKTVIEYYNDWNQGGQGSKKAPNTISF